MILPPVLQPMVFKELQDGQEGVQLSDAEWFAKCKDMFYWPRMKYNTVQKWQKVAKHQGSQVKGDWVVTSIGRDPCEETEGGHGIRDIVGIGSPEGQSLVSQESNGAVMQQRPITEVEVRGHRKDPGVGDSQEKEDLAVKVIKQRQVTAGNANGHYDGLGVRKSKVKEDLAVKVMPQGQVTEVEVNDGKEDSGVLEKGPIRWLREQGWDEAGVASGSDYHLYVGVEGHPCRNKERVSNERLLRKSEQQVLGNDVAEKVLETEGLHFNALDAFDGDPCQDKERLPQERHVREKEEWCGVKGDVAEKPSRTEDLQDIAIDGDYCGDKERVPGEGLVRRPEKQQAVRSDAAERPLKTEDLQCIAIDSYPGRDNRGVAEEVEVMLPGKQQVIKVDAAEEYHVIQSQQEVVNSKCHGVEEKRVMEEIMVYRQAEQLDCEDNVVVESDAEYNVKMTGKDGEKKTEVERKGDGHGTAESSAKEHGLHRRRHHSRFREWLNWLHGGKSPVIGCIYEV